MSSTESVTESITVVAERIGGIDRTEVTLDPGVNVLTGRNATNRTSFLQSIMAAIGSDRPSLKGDAESGYAKLSIGDEEYSRTLERRGDAVSFDGDPYLEDPELADLFAFLLESNRARRAVRRGDDLRELIMQPIDTDEIEAEIEARKAEKRDVDDRLERLDELETELPALEERRRAIDADIESKTERLTEKRATLDEFEFDIDSDATDRTEIEGTFETLQDVRAELDSIEYELEIERESLTELEAERAEIEAELDEFDEDLESPDRVDGRIQELRDRKRSLESTLNELQSVIRFNENRLTDDGFELDVPSPESDSNAESPAHEADAGELTDQLLAESTDVVCWTCGSTVERNRIESMLEQLRSLHQSKLGERNELQDRIDDLSSRQEELRERIERRRELEERRSSIEDELDRRRTRIAELEDDREAKRERIEEIEARTDDLETADYGEVIEIHREITELELQLEDLEAERDEVRDRIDEIEGKLDERDELEDRRAGITDELAELRTRVERIETNAVDAFNEHMDSILSILDYGNLERIWIERRERSDRDGRAHDSVAAFDLHIVRATDDGATYEDRIEHLSESEREVTGLIFALAGFLVHDVHESVPFILLDSLEAIDAARIADLVAYFEEYVEYLVVALLHEDAEALPDSYAYVTEI